MRGVQRTVRLLLRFLFLVGLIFTLIPRKGALGVEDQCFRCYMLAMHITPFHQQLDLWQFAMILGSSTIPWEERTREFLQRIGSVLDGSF